jgi:hypothetical protein
MGQAKNRKAEIDKLKASGAKHIKPFIIRGDIVDGKVMYDTTKLEANQARFVDGCVDVINKQQIPEMKVVPTQENSLTLIMYLNPDDFAGMLAHDLKVTPDEAWTEYLMKFNKHHSKYPQLGFTYTRDEIVEMGTEMAGHMMDMLSEGGQWPWPNARAVFEKQGDKLVVVNTI